MKKTYTKPEIEIIDFRVLDDIMIDDDIIDASMGVSDEDAPF